MPSLLKTALFGYLAMNFGTPVRANCIFDGLIKPMKCGGPWEVWNGVGPSSATGKVKTIFEKYRKATPENQLKWEDRFGGTRSNYIDKIKALDLKKGVMWGVDCACRPFIALKYAYRDFIDGAIKVCAVTFFQRYTDRADEVAPAGHTKDEACRDLGKLDPVRSPNTFHATLDSLLKNKEPVSLDGDGRINAELVPDDLSQHDNL